VHYPASSTAQQMQMQLRDHTYHDDVVGDNF
jgi:hypothetical protein